MTESVRSGKERDNRWAWNKRYMIHPSDNAMTEMGRNLFARLQPLLPIT